MICGGDGNGGFGSIGGIGASGGGIEAQAASVSVCLLVTFPELQGSLLGMAVSFEMALPCTIVAFSRFTSISTRVRGSLMTVFGVVVCHFAVVAIFLVRLPVPATVVSPPSAAASETSAKTSTVAAAIAVCICVHGSTEVAIGIADVLCDCCSGSLLLDRGYHFFDRRFRGSAHKDFNGYFELVWEGGVNVGAELIIGNSIVGPSKLLAVVKKPAEVFRDRLVFDGACISELPEEGCSAGARGGCIEASFEGFPHILGIGQMVNIRLNIWRAGEGDYISGLGRSLLVIFIVNVKELRFVFFAEYNSIGIDLLQDAEDGPLP